MIGALRGGRRPVARSVAGAVMLAISAGVICWAILSLADASRTQVHALVVLGGSILLLACLLGPVLLSGTDQLDPRRFAPFRLSPHTLPAALAVAGLVSLPVIAIAAVMVCLAIAWVAQGSPPVIAVATALLGLVTCVLSVRVSLAVNALVFRERRSRELSGLFFLVVLVVVLPVTIFLTSLDWRGAVPASLQPLVDTLTITPLGAVWSLPHAVAEGGGWIQTLVAVGFVGLLWWAWTALVQRLLGVSGHDLRGAERAGLGWFAVLPATPTGVIAARSLIYWLRDRRYQVNVVVVPFAGVLAAIPLLVAGVPGPIAALVPVPVIALFLGWLPHNDVAYDSTAVWMHLSSAVRGLADRIGRLAPITLIGVPLLAIAIPVAVALNGDWAVTPALIGVAISLFLGGLGFSSVASVAGPYPVAQPGDSPFQQPQRTGSTGVIAQLIVIGGTLAVSAAPLWWAWRAVGGEQEFITLALWGGVTIGVGTLVVGVVAGAVVFRLSGSRLLQLAEAGS